MVGALKALCKRNPAAEVAAAVPSSEPFFLFRPSWLLGFLTVCRRSKKRLNPPFFCCASACESLPLRSGCILLNAAMTDVVLVKCWKGRSRGLPKGKINQGERAIDAAVREVGLLLYNRSTCPLSTQDLGRFVCNL